MKVSIILPAYNAEKTIKKTIDSILNQTYKDFELIIINDGSTDNTLSILKKIEKKDKRIIVISQSNHGVSYSRNQGINISTGDYISFIDSDDWIENNYLERMLNIIALKKVDFVRCNYYIDNNNNNNNNTIKAKMYDTSNKIFYRNELNDSKIIDHFFYKNQPINNYVMLLLIKTELIKNNICFDENLSMMEDVLFYAQLFNCSTSFYLLDECLYHYNNCTVSLTRNVKRVETNVFGILNSISKIEKYFISNDIKFNKKSLYSNCINLIINYIEKLEKYDFNKTLKKILNNLYKDRYFCSIIKQTSLKDFNLYRKIIIFLLKRKNYYLLIKILKIRKKIKVDD